MVHGQTKLLTTSLLKPERRPQVDINKSGGGYFSGEIHLAEVLRGCFPQVLSVSD